MEQNDKTLEIIQALGQNLSGPWRDYVGYTLTGSIIYFAAFVCLFILCMVGLYMFLLASKSEDADDNTKGCAEVLAIFSALLLLISLAAIAAVVPSLLYPEGRAVQKIVSSKN